MKVISRSADGKRAKIVNNGKTQHAHLIPGTRNKFTVIEYPNTSFKSSGVEIVVEIPAGA